MFLFNTYKTYNQLHGTAASSSLYLTQHIPEGTTASDKSVMHNVRASEIEKLNSRHLPAEWVPTG